MYVSSCGSAIEGIRGHRKCRVTEGIAATQMCDKSAACRTAAATSRHGVKRLPTNLFSL